jgi:hypothetical protein
MIAHGSTPNVDGGMGSRVKSHLAAHSIGTRLCSKGGDVVWSVDKGD